MAATPSGVVTATLNYFLELENGGDPVFRPGTVAEKRRKFQPAQVYIRDIRGSEPEDFTLDRHGFQLVTKDTAERTFDDDERIKTLYYKECAELIKEVTGASVVKPFFHNIRRLGWDAAYEKEKDMPDNAPAVGTTTARFVHCDNTLECAYDRIRTMFPEDAGKLDQCRWAYINVWRPFDYPATRETLCFADYASIRDDELRRMEIVFPLPPAGSSSPGGDRDSCDDDDDSTGGKNGDANASAHHSSSRPGLRTGQGWQCAAPKTSDQHRWYYASEMKLNEALLLKICDSKKRVANKVFHSSFEGEMDYGPERHSLEVRCAVFWEDQPVE